MTTVYLVRVSARVRWKQEEHRRDVDSDKVSFLSQSCGTGSFYLQIFDPKEHACETWIFQTSLSALLKHLWELNSPINEMRLSF